MIKIVRACEIRPQGLWSVLLRCGRGESRRAHLRGAAPASISLAPTHGTIGKMRPETERNIDEIQQAVALLRRHL